MPYLTTKRPILRRRLEFIFTARAPYGAPLPEADETSLPAPSLRRASLPCASAPKQPPHKILLPFTQKKKERCQPDKTAQGQEHHFANATHTTCKAAVKRLAKPTVPFANCKTAICSLLRQTRLFVLRREESSYVTENKTLFCGGLTQEREPPSALLRTRVRCPSPSRGISSAAGCRKRKKNGYSFKESPS